MASFNFLNWRFYPVDKELLSFFVRRWPVKFGCSCTLHNRLPDDKQDLVLRLVESRYIPDLYQILVAHVIIINLQVKNKYVFIIFKNR